MLDNSRLTDRVHTAIRSARKIADGHDYGELHPIHIMLGILNDPKCVGSSVLVNLDVDVRELRNSLYAALGPRSHDGIEKDLPKSRNTRILFRSAQSAAQEADHNYIGTEHFVAAMLKLDNDPVCMQLMRMGITYGELLDEIKQLVADGPEPSNLMTDDAEYVLRVATCHAIAHRREHIELSDIFSALLTDEDCLAYRTMKEYCGEDQAPSALLQYMPSPPDGVNMENTFKELPNSPEVDELLGKARELSVYFDHKRVGTGHFLMAFCHTQDAQVQSLLVKAKMPHREHVEATVQSLILSCAAG